MNRIKNNIGRMELIIIFLFDIAIIISAILTFINEGDLLESIIAGIVIITLFNFIMVEGFIFVGKIENRLNKVKDNYSINMWLSESDNLPINILTDLINIKSRKNDLLYNYNKTKEVILDECKTKEELEVLKIFLEVNKESKRKEMYNISFQSILIAISIPIFVEMVKLKASFDVVSVVLLLFFVLLGMYFLITLNNARKSNKVNFLLKIVQKCIEENELRED
ncbi:hypothetical protein MHB50_16010 [Siminovitchia sp. FSL H7-0308]|uniref:hypothetical protein n=1 Tax=Siminovitchia sp. FSL H7-0308 TaxID=2921432 RepID=UPI0030EB86F2